jgi:hypothetical protein
LLFDGRLSVINGYSLAKTKSMRKEPKPKKEGEYIGFSEYKGKS